MSSIVALPYEITRQIVEHIPENPPSSLSQSDTHNLGVSTLISRVHWLAASRNLLWRHFVIPRHNKTRFEAMRDIFSSENSTLAAYDVRELLYDGTDWFSVPGRSTTCGNEVLEWLGSLWNRDDRGYETVAERFFGNVRRLGFRGVDMVKGDGVSIGMGVVNAPEEVQTLSPEAHQTFMHSFLGVTTLELRIVWMCSPEQLVEMACSFPKLVVLVLDQIRFHPMNTTQAKGVYGVGMGPRLQTLELLSPQSRFLVDTLHAFTPCTGLRCFKISGTALNGASLDAMVALCSSSSQFEELSMVNMSNEVDDVGEYLIGPGREVVGDLVQGLTRLTLDVQHLRTLSMPKLQWTSRADISALDELVPAMFPKLKALEFVVCVASDRAEEERWQKSVDDGCYRQTPSLECGPAWNRAKRIADEVMSDLPACAANGWLRPINSFYVVEESDNGTGSQWM
ncbi:hypothetical protein AAF712_013382 [Marasmius tenuissimus]|uniref:F-box domain-containing protein n=1 Tax=Marasmius tenuissimus TaxID=585030 RepID=A0ABR2ZFT3_9AGAR